MTDKEIEQVRKDRVKKLLQKLHNKTFELVDSCDNECEESFEVVDRFDLENVAKEYGVDLRNKEDK